MIKRYTLPKMAKVWDQQTRFERMLEVEVLTCEALAKLGKIPTKAAAHIRNRAKFNIERIKEIERQTHHDVVAFVVNLSENIGEDARFLHMGLTSSDVLDTALACQMKESSDILIDDIKRLLAVIRQKAKKYKNTPMIGRSHGVHAEPTTFGLKMALWWDETQRNLRRLTAAREIVSVGKISGAVGTYANIDPKVEEWVCRRLRLAPAKISTQIVQRDRHAQYLTTLSLIGTSLEKFATEIRGLQRTEVGEVEEFFGRHQTGSSAMPHKKNPINCERICGMARLLRGNALASMENIALWHERDISHSSVERVILPDSTIVLDYMLQKFTEVLKGLVVYPDRMKRNLKLSGGIIFSERVLLELIKKGLSRQDAYGLVQRCAMKARRLEMDFKDALLDDRAITKRLSGEEIEECFNLEHHLKWVDHIFKKVGI